MAHIGQEIPRQTAPPPLPTHEGSLVAPTVLSDTTALAFVDAWKALFPDAMPLPGIGLPSQNQGVLTFTHSMSTPSMPLPAPMTIDGLTSRSPLANNALGSAEVSNGRWVNLYEIMLPEIPGANGKPSSIQRYTDALQRQGVQVAGKHYHWDGSQMLGLFPIAIHSQSTNSLDPVQFANAHLLAVRAAFTFTP